MSEHFNCISFEKLVSLIFSEYENNKTILGIPENLFFKPEKNSPIAIKKHGKLLETPFGVAAGPQTQMAQNIVAAWLTGSRFIELKTVQTLDEIKVSKPCIDIEDEGYNCEWSQELRLTEAYDEYVKAWVLIHVLRHKLGHDNGTDELGTIFNMSAGYNLEGLKKPNVQNFFKNMFDASELIIKYKNIASNYYKPSENLIIPSKLSDNITLSTMHGCPPAEIEKIAIYLLKELGLHTTVKFNPTLIGQEKLNYILNEKLGFETHVPDEAFGHDPVYSDAMNIIANVSEAAFSCGKDFSFKLSNTLESVNHRDIFPPHEKMMYMSGRPLHVIDVNLADKMNNDLNGYFEISFSGGANSSNVASLLSCNIRPITVCSDLLKPGGYMRMGQYISNIVNEYKKLNASDIDEFVCKTWFSKYFNADKFKNKYEEFENLDKFRELILSSSLDKAVKELFSEKSEKEQKQIKSKIVKTCSMLNNSAYAQEVLENPVYKKEFCHTKSYKGNYTLNYFDCIKAPCMEECPVSQNVPEYMRQVASENFDNAAKVVFDDNILANIAGRVCDHKCTEKCVRTHYETPLQIREIKRFITENSKSENVSSSSHKNKKAAIIGGGPAGLTCAYYLASNGVEVTLYEEKEKVGGMASYAIPSFRLPATNIQIDSDKIKKMGVKIINGHKVTKEEFLKLKNEFNFVFIGAGAQKGMNIGVEGENSEGVTDALVFLKKLREGKRDFNVKNILVIGGGNSACDVARAAWRLSDDTNVTIVYRRTKKEMPADTEEIEALLEEGIKIVELAAPKSVKTENGKVSALTCQKMKLGEKDSSGRRRPVPVEGSEFDIPADLIVSAIGQKTVLDFIEGSDIKLTSWNTIEVDPKTQQTSVSNVYAGGDVVRGAMTLIKASGDGKRAALSMLDIKPVKKSVNMVDKKNYIEALTKKANIQFALKPEEVEIDKRKNFDEVCSTFDKNQAVKEAKRCLSCDEFCSICATVCPNRANITYFTKQVSIPQSFKIVDDEIIFSKHDFSVNQPSQIINIGDFCNECGNCETFCPSKNAPYKNKPTFYLTEKSFNEHSEDCFMFTEKGGKKLLYGRKNGFVHELWKEENGFYNYKGEFFTAKFDLENTEFVEIDLLSTEYKDYSTEMLFNMIVLYQVEL
ncbi:MAG: FAD-dependent oxidoreductase [Candidatus Muiribacteriota bacterium]